VVVVLVLVVVVDVVVVDVVVDVVVVGGNVVLVVVVKVEIVPSNSQHISGGKYVANIFNKTSIRVSPLATFIQSKSIPEYVTHVISIGSPSHGSGTLHVVSPVTPGGVQNAHGSHVLEALLQLQDIMELKL
jgi:hypothetical protein